MYYYFVFLLFTIDFGSAFTHGQRTTETFRNDYHFLEETQSYYKIHTIAKTWAQAKETCSLENSQLFYPQNKLEFDAVAKYWKDTHGSNEYIFIGISAVFVPTVFDSVDGVPIFKIQYNNWRKDEPNNANGKENVLEINIVDGFLNDTPDSNKHLFICKKTLASLQNENQCLNDGTSISDTSFIIHDDLLNNDDHLCFQKDYVYKDSTNRCYKFGLVPKTWNQAYELCRSEQSYLSIINSDLEASVLSTMVWNAPKERAIGKYTPGSVHLGFYRSANEGWRTLKGSSLEKSGYTRFGYDSQTDSDKLKCGAMFYNGELRDINCDEKCFYICEREIENAKQPNLIDQILKTAETL